MKKFGVVVTQRSTGERWVHSTWEDLEQAESQRKALENAMPGAVIRIRDWSERLSCSRLPKVTQYPGE